MRWMGKWKACQIEEMIDKWKWQVKIFCLRDWLSLTTGLSNPNFQWPSTWNNCNSYYSGMVNCTAACASLIKQSCYCVDFPASLYMSGWYWTDGTKGWMCGAADVREVNDRDWWVVDIEWYIDCGEAVGRCGDVVGGCGDVSWDGEVWLYDPLPQARWCRHRPRHSSICQIAWCLLLRYLWLLPRQLLLF